MAHICNINYEKKYTNKEQLFINIFILTTTENHIIYTMVVEKITLMYFLRFKCFFRFDLQEPKFQLTRAKISSSINSLGSFFSSMYINGHRAIGHLISTFLSLIVTYLIPFLIVSVLFRSTNEFATCLSFLRFQYLTVTSLK